VTFFWNVDSLISVKLFCARDSRTQRVLW